MSFVGNSATSTTTQFGLVCQYTRTAAPELPRCLNSSSAVHHSGGTAYLKSQGIDYDAVFARIHDLIVKSIIAVEANIEARSNSTGFELYGFDVIIDEALRPWLLEVQGPKCRKIHIMPNCQKLHKCPNI